MMEQNNTNCLGKLWQMTHLQSSTLLFCGNTLKRCQWLQQFGKKLHFWTDKKGIDMTKWVLDRAKRGLIRRWHKMKSREILEWCSRAVELHCTRKGQKRIPRVNKDERRLTHWRLMRICRKLSFSCCTRCIKAKFCTASYLFWVEAIYAEPWCTHTHMPIFLVSFVSDEIKFVYLFSTFLDALASLDFTLVSESSCHLVICQSGSL